MVIYRQNPAHPTLVSTAEQRLASVERHRERARVNLPTEVLPAPTVPDDGDVVYGAKAIAHFIFGANDNRTRRRVFNLWSHYKAREERAGFFKLKGALCLSKAQWRTFHGL